MTRFGYDTFLTPFQAKSLEHDSMDILSIKTGDTHILRSIGVSPPNLPILDLTNGDITETERDIQIRYRLDKIHVNRSNLIENIPSHVFDPFEIVIMAMSSVVNRRISLASANREVLTTKLADPFLPVMPIAISSGRYIIRDGNNNVTINLSAGYFFDSSETLIICETETPILEDEIGKVIGEIPTFLINEVRYLSLLAIMQTTLPLIDGLTYSVEYPARPLGKQEFSMEYGKLVFGSHFTGHIQMSLVYSTNIETRLDKSINGLRLISERSRQIKRNYKLSDYDFSRVVKLRDTNILPQSATFDISEASVNTFIAEVEFVDGQTEFSITKKHIQTGNRGQNNIRLHDNYSPSRAMVFRDCDDIFVSSVFSENELVYAGDYYIYQDQTDFYWYVKLPDGITTSETSDSVLIYYITPSNRSSAGLYSIDYVLGILYAPGPIDGQTRIHYEYSSVFGVYRRLDDVPSNDYSISGGRLSIAPANIGNDDYLLISSKTAPVGIDYRVSPLIRDLKINIIDTKSSI